MKVDYKFKVDGFYDYVNYYTSDSFINTESPPPVKIGNITELSFSDDSIIQNKNYFFVLSSIRNGVEKFSENLFLSTFKINKSINNLFESKNKGGAYDFNDLLKMYQDSQKKIIVTGVDQPVGFVYDKSGNGNHLTSSGNNRPILKKNSTTGAFYLSFDGNKFMQCQNFNISNNTEISVFSGINFKDFNSTKIIAEQGNDYNSNSGSFITLVSDSTFSFGMNSPYSLAVTNINSPLKKVISIYANREKPNNKIEYIRLNGVSMDLNRQLDSTTGSFLNNTLNVGSRAGNEFFINSDYYSLIIICKKPTELEVSDVEASISSLIGL